MLQQNKSREILLDIRFKLCDECDECENTKKKIFRDYIESSSISSLAGKDETNDDQYKQLIELNSNSLSVNQVNVVDKITIIEEVNNRKGKDIENAKIKKIAKSEISSYPSHSPHNTNSKDLANPISYAYSKDSSEPLSIASVTALCQRFTDTVRMLCCMISLSKCI